MSALSEVAEGVQRCASLCMSGPRSLSWIELRGEWSMRDLAAAGCVDSPEWSPAGAVYQSFGLFGHLGPVRL